MTVVDGASTMKRLQGVVSLVLISIVVGVGCNDYVTSLDPFIDVIEDTQLDTPERVPFLVTGVKQQLAYTVDDLVVNAAGLSDEFIFDLRTPTAVFPQFEEVHNARPLLTNYQVENMNAHIALVRLIAPDTLRGT